MKKAFIKIWLNFFRAELIRGSFYIMIASTIGGILSLVFNLFLVRTVSESEYGIYNSLATFSILATVFSQSITTVITQYATPLIARREMKKAAYLYALATKYVLIICGVIFLINIVFSQVLSSFLHINNFLYILIVALFISFSYFNVVNSAFLQGLLKFSFIAWTGFMGSLLRLLFGVGVVLLGAHVYGALGSILVSGLFILIIGFYPLRFIIFSKKEQVIFSKKDVLYYALSVSIIAFSLISFTSTDIILVKHFFSPVKAGLYSELSIPGKAIFYFTAPISTVLFPLIIKKYHGGGNFLKTFYGALFLVFFPSVSITIFYFLFPHFALNLFLGGKLSLSPYIGFYALYITVFSLLNITITFLLSLKKTSIIFPMAGGAILQVVLIAIFHSGFLQIILISLAIVSILLVGILLYYVRYYGPEKFRKNPFLVVNNTGL